MDGARANDDQQPIILAGQNVLNFPPGLEHRFGRLGGNRKFLVSLMRRDDLLDAGNPEIVGIEGIVCDRNVFHGLIHKCNSRLRDPSRGSRLIWR